MLKVLVPKLLCPSCLKPEHTLVPHVFTDGTEGHIRDGVLVCPGCRSWVPIQDDLLELVKAALLEPKDHARFCARFGKQLADLGFATTSGADEPAPSDNGVEAQLKQREHFDWWAENDQLDYRTYQMTPFWVAADAVAFGRWLPRVKPGSWLLDLGCADGRSAASLIDPQRTVIGFDISKRMVRQAIERARAMKREATTTFLVADADTLPFREQSFDYVLTYGVLHHFPNPGDTCREIQRVLKDQGIHFGSENSKSIFRAIFDWLMRIKPLWKEEAGEEPLISEEMLKDWTKGLQVKFAVRTSVFLPPHLFNLVGRRVARPLLNVSDRVCSIVPGLRKQGGLIVFEIAKTSGRA